MQNLFLFVLFCFLSEQEACDFFSFFGGGGRICTVLLTKLVKPPNESCETGREEATSWSHFLIVVGRVSDDIIMTGFG